MEPIQYNLPFQNSSGWIFDLENLSVYMFGCINSENAALFCHFIDTILTHNAHLMTTHYYDSARATLNRNPSVLELKILINSDGGDMDAAMSIYKKITTIPMRTIGVVEGRACSAASVILCACSERIGHRYSTIMIHDLSINILDATSTQVSNFSQYFDILRMQIAEIYNKITKKPIKDILKDLASNTDMYLTVDDAQAYGKNGFYTSII